MQNHGMNEEEKNEEIIIMPITAFPFGKCDQNSF